MIGVGYGKEILVGYVAIFRDGNSMFFIDCIPAVARYDQPSGSLTLSGGTVDSGAGFANVRFDKGESTVM